MRVIFSFLIMFFGLFSSFAAWGIEIVIPCDMSEIGKQRYNTTDKRMEICTGLDWQGINGGTLSACAAADKGKQRFNANVMEYCNGTNWISMNVCPTTTSACSQGGRIRLTIQGRSLYCDGTYWAVIAGGCAAKLNCEEHIDSPSCTADATCKWIAGGCVQNVGCAGYTVAATCNADPNCTWASGTGCADNF